jgi:hypothetical protein
LFRACLHQPMQTVANIERAIYGTEPPRNLFGRTLESSEPIKLTKSMLVKKGIRIERKNSRVYNTEIAISCWRKGIPSEACSARLQTPPGRWIPETENPPNCRSKKCRSTLWDKDGVDGRTKEARIKAGRSRSTPKKH